ncbi:hypothetical protein LWH94_16100 [Marinobacter sp. G11]|uniref:hypothetical protein n=1 Tax=Marinobacter sp. G11 TaxID=2903522 RepID=UPI001E38A9A0|nr:hypothetical protein [Marinobacter sp. G11]MCE0760715.1 hypothetical protein [Marinobacter sp. G11]
MAIEQYCDGAVDASPAAQERGPCNCCGAITENWYRNYNGESGFECARCLEQAKSTEWGDIHA